MRNYAPDMPRPTEARCATLNIELQKRTPSRHRGNYYACGHREPRTNNPELWVEEIERIENICSSRIVPRGIVARVRQIYPWI